MTGHESNGWDDDPSRATGAAYTSKRRQALRASTPGGTGSPSLESFWKPYRWGNANPGLVAEIRYRLAVDRG